MNLDLTTKMNPIEEFMYTIKSKETKKMYQHYIKYFEGFAGISLSELLKTNIDQIQNILIQYIIMMRDKGLSSSTIKGRIAPVSSFLQLNDLVLNNKKISKFYGEDRKTVTDQAYTTQDIKDMLNIAKPRMRVMILIYSSTGIRKSALLDLKLKHITKIPEFNLYRFTIYENTREQYTTYCTPECATAIDEYIEYRKQAGETITKESYLVRNDFGKFNLKSIKNPEPVTEKSINTVFRQLLLRANLRDEHENQYERRDKAMFHALRKFTMTQFVKSGVNPEIREMLLGHKIGLSGVYYRPTESDMITQYACAINDLTIDEAYKWKQKYEQSQIDNKVLERQEAEIKALRQQLETKVKSFEEAMASFPIFEKQTKNQKVDIIRIKRKDLEQ